MSTLISAAAAAGPLAVGWSVHTLWMRRRIDAARRDPLTGLPGREAFTARAERLARRTPLAVVFIDLDGFKAVNDHFGHDAGDAVLTGVGSRLAVMAHGGLAARLGGDEFAVVIRHQAPDCLPALLRSVHDWICVPVEHDGRLLTVGASVGGFWSGDHPAEGLSAALRRADEAMYEAKRNGGGWQMAAGPERAYDTVNGRRDGRPGTHLDKRGGTR